MVNNTIKRKDGINASLEQVGLAFRGRHKTNSHLGTMTV
jgi:hypothetical protein